MKNSLLFTGALLGILLPCTLLAKTTARETTIELPTYPFSSPDPIPHPENDSLWPYFKFDQYSPKSTPQQWKCVLLENDKILVEIFPQIGGKIWGAKDKETGKYFLYRNSVVKFRNVSMRGPWTSGGIEFNFGLIGHAPTASTPVDYYIRENPNGSASCFIGALELMTRTRWCIEIRLGSKDRFFTTHTLWFNESNLDQPCYQWMNAAYPDGGKYYINGDAYIGHGGEPGMWPIDARGRDISIYANNNYGGSRSSHIMHGDHGTIGVWWPEIKFGSLHEAAPYDRLGRKVWIWGLSRAGMIWENLLTDTDGQYVELQAGRYFNQPGFNSHKTPFKLESFDAGNTITFTEKWSPITSESQFPASAKIRKQYAARPLRTPKDFNWNSLYGRTLFAEQCVNVKRYHRAEPKLRSVLKEDPYFVPALVCLGDSLIHRNQNKEALEVLTKVLSIDTYNGKANYLCGLLYAEKDDPFNAIDCFGVAATSTEYRAPALAQTSAIYLKLGKAEDALRSAGSALASNPNHLYAHHLRLVALRKLGNKKAHDRLCGRLLVRYPLYHAFQYEKDPQNFVKEIRCELPHQELLELAFAYARAGQYSDAIDISEKGSNLLNKLTAAYFLHLSGKEEAAKAYLNKSISASPEYAFPRRREMTSVLDWAKANTDSWKPRYLRALLLRSFGEKALAEKEMAALDGNLLTTAALIFRSSLHSKEAARKDLLLAEKKGDNRYEPWEYYLNLTRENRWEEALPIIKKICKEFPENFDAGIHLANALVSLQRYDEALKTLNTIQILPSEGSSAVGGTRKLYRESCLGQAVNALLKKCVNVVAVKDAVQRSKIWNESLGVGKPYDSEIDLRLENWLLLQVAAPAEKAGLQAKICLSFDPKHKQDFFVPDGRFFVTDLLTALVLRDTGKKKAADAMVAKFPDGLEANWCKAYYNGTPEAKKRYPFQGGSDFRLLQKLLIK